MPSQSSRSISITPFVISLAVIAVALVALAIFWFSDDHTKRAVVAVVAALLVGGGAGYSAYAGL
jgi:RsiW-degrading membrane proteinase PrsW (M82 family)